MEILLPGSEITKNTNKKKLCTKSRFAQIFHLCQLLQAVASFHSYHMMSPALTRQGTSSHYQYCYLDIVI